MNVNLETRKITPPTFDPREDTVLAWLGMAGVLVNGRGTVLLIDPLITMANSDGETLCEGAYRLKVPLPVEAPDIPRIDAVLYTHGDHDHFGRLTAQAFAERRDCRFVAPPPVGRELETMGVGAERIMTAKDYDIIRLGNVDIQVTPALHDWQEADPWRRGDCCGYLLKTPDGAIWHPGDTRLIDELLAVKNVDVLFFDVAAVDAHLGPAGSARLAESCGARVMVAYHYGTFDLPPGSYGGCSPEDSLPYIAGLSAHFLLLNPGEILKLPLKD